LLFLQDKDADIGQRSGFSEKDIEKLKRMYADTR
jgi:hypothetical protein